MHQQTFGKCLPIFCTIESNLNFSTCLRVCATYFFVPNVIIVKQLVCAHKSDIISVSFHLCLRVASLRRLMQKANFSSQVFRSIE